jgi:transcriptional regulator with GAF, ATPase, and Fis domain
MLLEGTATTTGERFFEALVENMARALSTKHAWITEYIPELRRLRALAFWVDGELVPDFEIDIDGTPCEAVIDSARLVHYPDNIRELFPNSTKLSELGAVSYMGVPLTDLNGIILGHLAVIDDRPMPEEPRRMALFKIFASRAAAELQRIRAESEIKEREEKLRHLVAGAMDAIIELNRHFDIVMLNPAAEMLLNFRLSDIGDHGFCRFLSTESCRKLTALAKVLTRRPPGKRYLWVPGGLDVIDSADQLIESEATLSNFEMQGKSFYALVLRNINERIEAEREIHLLREERAYLKNEIEALGTFEEIVGQSRPLVEVLRSVKQVATTDATVLIIGETGTGKELIARAINQSSARSRRPFITINCAALTENLVESELYGHEPGAFTGADRQRQGRFELADGGTLFLDEISELSLEVQAKLLRVLQEAKFERVGGSKTLSVDVRIIAATNRDLQQEIIAGRFRADLFYRLNVYPITVPPLRDRKEDIPLLVEYFVGRLSHRIRKVIRRIPSSTMDQLVAYEWPGNVRELKNVVERAIITSQTAELHLPEALGRRMNIPQVPVSPDNGDLPTLAYVERKYITHVLQSTGWRISGPKGAAKTLNLNPSTLRYRIKKLGITTPW